MNARNRRRGRFSSTAAGLPVILLLCLLSRVDVTHAYPENVAGTSDQQPERDLIVPVHAYEPPKAIKLREPRYPQSALNQGIEGWAVINFMVDPEGNTYEIEATGFGGHKSFIKAAVRAAQRHRYQPARANGKPIHAGVSVLVRFGIKGLDRGAHRIFVRNYRKFTRAVAARDDAAIQKHLQLLNNFKTKRIYEMAHLELARAVHAQYRNHPETALRHLTNAIHWEKEFSIFSKKEYRQLLGNLFWLQVQNHHLAAALETWQIIETQLSDSSHRAEYETAVQQILDIKDSGKPFSAHVTIHDHYSARRKLLTQAFGLFNVDGALSEGKLYCDKGYLSIKVEPQMRYDICDDYQNCDLVLKGDPGTSFTITENPLP